MFDLQLRKVLVMALARSGHHAVMHWLCKRFPGVVVFHNNCNHLLRWRNRTVYKNGIAPGRTHVFSFENFDLRGFKELGLSGQFDNIILINRDPYNWIASSMAKGKYAKLAILNKPFRSSQHRVQYPDYFCNSMSRLDMFVQYMRQCLGGEDFIGEKFHHINYNKWFSDQEYRKRICRRLKIPFSDEGKDYVPPRGSGSSFDGRKFKGHGSQMDVLGRWKYYKDDSKYLGFLTDEIREYSKRYFDFNPL